MRHYAIIMIHSQLTIIVLSCELESTLLPTSRTVHFTFVSASRMRTKRALAGLSVPFTSNRTEFPAFVSRMRWTYTRCFLFLIIIIIIIV